MALIRKGFIPISPGKRADFDHADVYRCESAATSRLYVAHTGADRIEVIECSSNTHVRSLPDAPGVAGILIDSTQDFLFSSDRGCARASIYRCSDETLLGRVGVGHRPNALAYDPDRRQLFVFNVGDPPGVNCTTSVVAVDEMRVIKTIPLPGRPRWAVYDAATEHVYANIQEPAQIIGLSATDLKITRAFPVPVAGPHGLVIAGERLFCAADGAALVALNRDTGAVLGSVALPGAPDVVMHDPALARLYVAIGSPGVISVIDDQSLKMLQTVPTESGAHTIGWNPDTRTLYAFLPASGGAAVFVEQEKMDLKPEEPIETEDEDTASAASSARVTLRSIMTQREMEILTTWFPKTAQRLVRVVRTRQRFLEPYTCPQYSQQKEVKAMKWVTRERPKVDRVACPWLIKRFVDPQAEFLYVPPEEVMEAARREGAIPFDVPNAELGHHGPECSFDAIIKKYKLSDPALKRLAVIVRGADTAARELALESAGLEAIAEGFRLIYRNDHELLERESPVYDALYAYCQSIEERKTIP